MSRRAILYVGLLCAASLLTLTGRHTDVQQDRSPFKPAPARVSAAVTTTTRVPGTFSDSVSPNVVRVHPARDTEEEEPAWLIEARDDPDPAVRLQAIELWAHDPGDNLNPFTYALVDPDESVRARAEELLEAALAWR